MRIVSQLIVTFLAIALIPIISIGIIDFYDFSYSLESEALNNLNTISEIEEKRLVEEINHSFELLGLVTSRTALREQLGEYLDTENTSSQQRMNKILSDASLSVDAIHNVSIINMNGQIIASSNLDKIGIFADMFENDVGSGSFGTKHYDFFKENKIIVAHVSDKIYYDETHYAIIELDINARNILAETDYPGLGDSGEYVIAQSDLNGDAVFINQLKHQDDPDVLSIVPKERMDIPITHAIAKVERTFTDLVDYRGEPVFAVTKYIDNTPLGFVVKIDKQEVFAPLIQKQTRTLILLLFTSAPIILISALMSDKFAKNTTILKDTLKKIGSGDFSAKAIVSGADEIKELATAINSVGVSLEEKVTLVNQLKTAQQELESAKFTTIGKLASRMSHDLRNPLSIIQISLENIRTLYGADEIQATQFEKIERSMDRIIHQIDNVLDFVREQTPELNKINFSKILAESLDSLTMPDDVELILPKNDVELFADEKLFSIALNNLILNSIQAIHGTGTIEIKCDENKDDIIIQVTDSGKGIPKENLDNIFEPLFTTKQQGTGLGLASVKSIIQAHNGTISVTSLPTIFTITLPKTFDSV